MSHASLLNRREILTAARFDAALGARVRACRPLLYSGGPDPLLDRSAHVRAGSGISWFGGRLAVIQDDANFIALVDPIEGSVDSIALPADSLGRRQFDELRGTKHLKMDLEACITIPNESGEWFLAWGSGSTDAREEIVFLRTSCGDGSAPMIVAASALFRELRACREFSGSELNLEGAVFLAGMVRIFNRGNGAPSQTLTPCNASCELPWEELRAYLLDPSRTPPPTPRNVLQYDLGRLDGLRLSFAAATVAHDLVLYAASAEDSPDTFGDGRVAGTVIGVFDAPDSVRWTQLRGLDESCFAGKVEGICPVPGNPNLLYAVIDCDDPAVPTELLEVELSGPWR